VASHKSARKRARQALRRRARNRHQQSRVRTAVKRAEEAIAEGNAESAGGALRTAESLLRRAASKGAIPRKRASRQVSRLAKAAHQLDG
jgi:small subunit ribosomal protein S20